MPLLTNGFADAYLLAEHFDTHVTIQREFPVTNEQDYLELADAFLGGPLGPDTLECVRRCRDGSRGDTIRYNRVTHEYGVLSVDNYIRTYFIPNPAVHRCGTNLSYFQRECRKVKC